MTTEYFRCLRPSGKHKCFRFQSKSGPKWVTVSSPEIQAFNRLVFAGVLCPQDALERSKGILASLYAKRDEGKADKSLLSNTRIVEAFMKEKYPPAKVRRMASRSLATEHGYMKIAMKALESLAVDGPYELIQEHLDLTLGAKPRKHKRLTTSINRLRKWLQLPLLQHLLPEHEEVAFIPEPLLLKKLELVPEPFRTLSACAFYSGLRRGELLALRKEDVRGDLIYVQRQVTVDLKITLPKHRKKRRAFILPGGEVWLAKYL